MMRSPRKKAPRRGTEGWLAGGYGTDTYGRAELWLSNAGPTDGDCKRAACLCHDPLFREHGHDVGNTEWHAGCPD